MRPEPDGQDPNPDPTPAGPCPPETTRHNPAPAPQSPPLSSLVDRVAAEARAGRGDVDSLIRAAGRNGTLPLMSVVAMLVVSPLSGIPFVPSICGITIALLAVQAALGRGAVWLPALIRHRRVNPRRTASALARVRGIARWLERHSTGRIRWLARWPFASLFLGLAALYGGAMPALEMLPMSSSLLAFAVVLIGLGLMLRDGLLLALSLAPPLLAGWIIWRLFPF